MDLSTLIDHSADKLAFSSWKRNIDKTTAPWLKNKRKLTQKAIARVLTKL